MGEICMRYLTQIFSFFVWIVGTLTSAAGRFSEAIDNGISIVAGIIGCIAGVVWLTILLIKKKESKLALENEKLENQIKKKQLENLENTEI